MTGFTRICTSNFNPLAQLHDIYIMQLSSIRLFGLYESQFFYYRYIKLEGRRAFNIFYYSPNNKPFSLVLKILKFQILKVKKKVGIHTEYLKNKMSQKWQNNFCFLKELQKFFIKHFEFHETIKTRWDNFTNKDENLLNFFSPVISAAWYISFKCQISCFCFERYLYNLLFIIYIMAKINVA